MQPAAPVVQLRPVDIGTFRVSHHRITTATIDSGVIAIIAQRGQVIQLQFQSKPRQWPGGESNPGTQGGGQRRIPRAVLIHMLQAIAEVQRRRTIAHHARQSVGAGFGTSREARAQASGQGDAKQRTF